MGGWEVGVGVAKSGGCEPPSYGSTCLASCVLDVGEFAALAFVGYIEEHAGHHVVIGLRHVQVVPTEQGARRGGVSR